MTSEFYLSLRFRHPTFNVVEFAHSLRIPVRHGWSAGDQRMTPQGHKLHGVYEYSYSVCDIDLSQINSFEEGLSKLVDLVRQSSFELQKFLDIDGKISAFVSITKDGLQGFTLSPSAMKELAILGIALEFDQIF